jgi:hypothetical protein
MIMFFPSTLTQLGQFKYGLLRNTVTGSVVLDRTYEPGWYWIGFWKDFVEFPSTLNTIEFSNDEVEEGVQQLAPLRSRDKDGKLIFLHVSIQYRLLPELVPKLYKDMLTYYEDIMISELRDQIAKAANGFAVQDMWQDYKTVSDLLNQRCVTALTNRHAECWRLQLWGVKLSSQYENKLIQTQVRKQAQKTALATKNQEEVRAQTRVLVAEYSKKIQILKASGDADVYSLTQLAKSTASANIVRAQADQLQIIRDRVCLASAKVVNGTAKVCKASGPGVMTGAYMVEYEKQVLLKGLTSPHLILNTQGGKHPQAMNVESSRKIMNGHARRLLLHEGRQLEDEDVPLTTFHEL